MATPLWTAIARCSVCKKELNRAVGVPESAKALVIASAPLMAVCEDPAHNTFSDCNPTVELEWIQESDAAVESAR